MTGETPIAAYKTIRDSAVFTNRRLIIRDAQGLTGKKVEMYSIPYSSINMWSSENSGKLDFNADWESRGTRRASSASAMDGIEVLVGGIPHSVRLDD